MRNKKTGVIGHHEAAKSVGVWEKIPVGSEGLECKGGGV